MKDMSESSQDNPVIEFIGLPGIGKTTISRYLKEHLLESHNIKAIDAREKGFQLKSYNKYQKALVIIKNIFLKDGFWKFSLFYVSILRYGISLRPINKKAISESLNYWRARYQHIIKQKQLRERGMAIYDQGLYQQIWSIGMHGNKVNHKAFLFSVSQIAKLDKEKRLIVAVTGCHKEATKRIEERNRPGASRLESMPITQIETILKIHEKTMNLMVEELKKQYHQYIFVVSGHNEPLDNARLIAKQINEAFLQK